MAQLLYRGNVDRIVSLQLAFFSSAFFSPNLLSDVVPSVVVSERGNERKPS